MNHRFWMGVDLGGTKILAGVFTGDFKIVGRAKLPTEADKGPEGIFSQIRKAVATAMDEAGVKGSQIDGMGLCLPGQVDPHVKRVRYAPNLGWRDVDLPRYVPAHWSWPVHFENDVKLGTYGEYMHGAAKGAKSVLGIFVGTGVGGGIILNGEIYHGFNFCAGEIGHIIMHWRRGTELEAIAGRHSIMKRAADTLADAPRRVRREWKGVDLANVKSSQLAEFYQRDDPIAVQIVDDAARALGAAVGSLINFLSPEVIVIGGGVAGALGESFLERIWEIANRYTLPGAAEGIRLVPAALADDSGIFGAAALAKAKAGK